MTGDAFRWRPEEHLSPLDPRLSTQVKAADRADVLSAKAWARAAEVAQVLFDPTLVPALAERATAAEAEFYARCGESGDLHYDTQDTEYNPHVAHEQGVTRVWAVGTNHVDIVRDRWHDPLNANRECKPVDYFAGMYGNRVPDFFDCARYGCDGGDTCGRACTVRLAKTCGGPTGVMPVNRGTLILLFRCCRECEALASKIAANNRRSAIVRARADLPPGAVIMPDPDPNVNPDAWA